METYQGVKFTCVKRGGSYDYDERLEQLNRWAYVFAELGLTPLHSSGAYGNLSYRIDKASLMITRTGMTPSEQLDVTNFVHVDECDTANNTLYTRGEYEPSSESFLHASIYDAFPRVKAVLHGHSALLCRHAEELGIPVTARFEDYGTMALAASALTVLDEQHHCIILKDHGFVVVGEDIHQAGELALFFYAKLLKQLSRIL